ncbi:glycosyltransferase family 9 protein [Uliginosibacterium sp. TH139]|uniref:glycosyltransferase family 9 protein n=1 Tax=Uliginosibacterium sp. TH139 TaxID=2067453 RepID=UPI000C7E27F0|nr:glycosyltransferase family 9 protein [Uliginosibacterium sp. TH139]PLK50691.1 hypothetical protein C0V76_02445 [Uliginosibacterium sp. TH139]
MTASVPLPTPSATRPGLACGRYLFFNPLLRTAMRLIDALTGLRHSLARPMPASLAPDRILLCMQAHIGDLIYASAAIPVLRAAFPAARIDFLVHPAAAHLLAEHPELGQIHSLTHWKLDRSGQSLWRRLLRYLGARRTLLQTLRANHYALAVDLYAYFPNSIPLLASARIPLRLGWASGGFGGLLSHAREWDCAGQHILEWHRRLLAQIPACRPHLGHLQTSCPLPATALARSRELLQAAGIHSPFLCFHVGAGGAHKQWPEPAWHELALACAARGERIVLLGFGPAEEALAQRIAARVPAAAVSLAGQLDFTRLAGCIAQARLFVGLDSMGTHLAAAHAIPVVGIYPGIMDGSWRPAGRHSRIITTPKPCAPCFLPAGCASMACLRETPANAVFAAIEASLGEQVEAAHA